MRMIKLAALAILAAAAIPTAALAETGFSTANVNMRSGPSTQYPAVAVIPNGTRLEITGCLSRDTWCEVSIGRNRGWVSSSYLSVEQQGRRVRGRDWRAPVVTFEAGLYWDENYRGRGFYRDRDRWEDQDRRDRSRQDDRGRRPGRGDDDRGGRGR